MEASICCRAGEAEGTILGGGVVTGRFRKCAQVTPERLSYSVEHIA